jgi:hypothetical protein
LTCEVLKTSQACLIPQKIIPKNNCVTEWLLIYL